jgi:vancomycin resistance protein YoaR
MGFLPRLSVLAVLAGAFLGGAAYERPQLLPAGEVLPGVRVDGEPVRGALSTTVEARAAALLSRKVHLRSAAGDDLGERSLRDLGVRIDADAVAARARRFGHGGDWLTRIAEARRARRGEIDVPLSPAVDAAPLVALLVPYKENLDVPPASARLDLDHQNVVPEKPGRYLDAYGAIDAVVRAAADPNATSVVVPFAVVEPRVTSDFVRSLDVHSVLAQYETYFSRAGGQKRRGQNIDVGASRLDGVVLMPGEIVSFNAIVGDRSEANGFQRSWEIYKGEMVEGIGGGTCQVASTLHAAAFFGGLDVLERLPHSRPSAYIPMGLDSTVVYPIVDLKLRNPHPFPVVVHAKTDGNKLTVQLLGAGRPVKVTFGRELLDTKPYPRKVEEDPKLSGDHVLVKQHGLRGFRIKRTRTVTFEDGHRKVETNVDVYPPTTEIYAVPPDFDVSKLPPLPGSDDDDDDGQPAASAPTAASASPVPAAAPAADPEVKFTDAPGAHAPTSAQIHPEKTLTLTR